MRRRNYWGYEDSCCYAIHHFLQLMYSLIHFTRKCFWRLQKNFHALLPTGHTILCSCHPHTNWWRIRYLLSATAWLNNDTPAIFDGKNYKLFLCCLWESWGELMSWWVYKLVRWWVCKLLSWWVFELTSWWVCNMISWWVIELMS